MSDGTPAAIGEAAPLLVIALAARLRGRGLPVSTSDVLDAVRALGLVDLGRRSRVRYALRATLLKDASHEVLFRRSFDAVFPMARPRPSDDTASGDVPRADDTRDVLDAVARALRDGDDARLEEAVEQAIGHFGADDDGRSAGHHARRMLRRMSVPDLHRRYLEASPDEPYFDRAVTAVQARTALDQLERRLEDQLSGRLREGDGAARQQLEDVQDRPLLRAGPDELVAMRQAMRPLARRLAARLGDRRRRGGRGLDMRRTIRASMGTGGVPVTPVLRQRRPTRPDLVVLCDVSGSTAQFAPFTLTLLHAVHQEFRHVRSFVFIDGIVEVTDLLADSPGVLDPHHLLARRGLVAGNGRSDYAHALTRFLSAWGDTVSARTTVIVAGDARSHDRAPATAVVAELGRRSRRLYWLNPEPRAEWDTTDSRATEYAAHCIEAFEVSTIRQLTAAVARIV